MKKLLITLGILLLASSTALAGWKWNPFTSKPDYYSGQELNGTLAIGNGADGIETNGNVTALYFLGNGTFLTGINSTGVGYTNLTQYKNQTAWSTYYTNADGNYTPLTLGSNGEFLKSNGATSAPTWATPTGGAHDAVTVSNTSTVDLALSTQALTATVNTTWAATKQAADADLNTWAGVTPSANGQSLVASANYASMRGLLDLEAGTDFNAYDAGFVNMTTVVGLANLTNYLNKTTSDSTYMNATLAKDLVTTAPVTGGTDNILPGADSDVTIALTLTGDLVATAPVLINGTTSVDNIIPGADVDFTLSLNQLGDVVTTAPLTINGTTNVDNIIPGVDGDTTLALTMLGDLATTAPITGAANDIFPGADTDYTIAIPQANGTANGYLDSGNWTTFNSKLGTGGTGTGLTAINGTNVTSGTVAAARIADAYLLNNGDVGTGVYDFGGTSDFEIENGANPTVDTAGEVSVDTSATSGSMLRFYGDAAYALPAYSSKSFVIFNMTDADDIPVWKSPYAITMRALHAVTVGGANVTAGEFDANGANGAVVDSAWMAVTTTNTNDDGTLSNPSIDSGDWVGLIVNNCSANATLYFTFDYTVDSVN